MSANEAHFENACFDSTDQQTQQNDAVTEGKSNRTGTAEGSNNNIIQPEKNMTAQKKESPSKVSIISIGVLILVTIILVEATVLLVKQNGSKVSSNIVSPTIVTMTTTTPISSIRPRSCLDYRDSNYHSSGIYVVFSEDGKEVYEVYCDMETDGGGWTLVASVHEDDIEKKCSIRDRWSAFAGTAAYNRDKTAWENKETFGAVPNCTSDDYKNQGYFSIKADDVMIWHVPSNISLDEINTKAKFRYRTTNQFLRDVGGSLFSIFEDYFPLDIREYYSTFAIEFEAKRTKKAMEALYEQRDKIVTAVNNWYDYEDYSDSYIYDDNIYDGNGNRIRLTMFGKSNYIYYNTEYWWDWRSDFSTISSTSQPFMMISAIENKYQEYSYIQQEVFSRQINPSENQTSVDGSLEIGYFKLLYRSMQYIVDGYNTACEFHYVIYNEKDWRSTKPSRFELSYNDVYSSHRYVYYMVDGTPTNFLMGYILLLRNDSSPIHRDVLDEVALIVLEAIAEIPDLFNAFGGSDGLSVPVTFDVGSGNTTLETLPENLHTSVEPGYLQLRAYNQMGFPSALCPGVRMTYYPSEYVCIGGISNNAAHGGTCGDFSGWEGETEPNIYAGSHSEKDISTSILIFYR